MDMISLFVARPTEEASKYIVRAQKTMTLTSF